MDALIILTRGFISTTWLVILTLKTLLLPIDLTSFWIPTIATFGFLVCLENWILFIMSMKKCCVTNCKNTRSNKNILHLFPNPSKDLERFQLWINAIGGEISVLDDRTIYECRRVCHAYFEPQYHTRSKRLSANAVPTLNLTGIQTSPRLPMRDISNQLSSSSQSAPSTSEQPAISVEQPAVSVSSTLKDQNKRKHTAFQTPELVSLNYKLKKLQRANDSNIVRLRKAMKLTENQTFQKTIKQFSESAVIFTKLQFREIRKKITGRRFNKNEKVMALALYKQGPRAYKWLRKVFVLPSPLTLSRMIAKASLKAGINENLFSQLKQRVAKMSDTEKLCVLLFDEMSIKPHFDYNRRSDYIKGFVNNGINIKAQIADHALVFMVRGIQKNYKQALAYTFCAGSTPKLELALQIKVIIEKINSIGFNVVATICDQGATNVSAINYLINQTRIEYIKENKVFKNKVFEINGHKIVPLYDPPHLIKGIRNNLIIKNLKAKIDGCEKLAKWEHILNIYEENPSYQGIRLMPKLTENHVIPKKIFKMKVKYATQLFSHSVAANMGYLASKGILPSECTDTADIILFFDELFDSVNGSYNNFKKRSGKLLLGPVTPKSSHRMAWKKYKKILSSMTFIGNTRSSTVPSLTNWLQTIENIEYLVDILSQKYNLTSIWMRHFNQDPLENFFACIRSHGYRNNSPTCAGFEAAFASLLISNMSSVHSPGSNCEVDSCMVFKSLNKLFFGKPETSNYTTEVDFDDINSDHVFISLDQKRANLKIRAQLDYVTGYVLSKLKLKCKDCRDCLYSNNTENDYFLYKEYFKNKKCLAYPSMQLIECFSKIQDVVTRVLKKDSRKNHIRQYLKTIFSVVLEYKFIKCIPHKQILIDKIENISVNIFVYSWCKNTNKLLNGQRTDLDYDDKIQKLAYEYCKKRLK